MIALTQWLTSDWHGLMPYWLADIVLVLVAALCGGLVGAERERKEKTTGMRTLALVSFGAAVFTLLSIDPRIKDGRITAQIISGIGFLGAGAIIHGRFGVAGLTSAATIWAVAAVGMTVGLGYGGSGIAMSFFVLFVLSTAARLERHYIGGCMFAQVHLTCDHDGGKTLIKVEGILDEFDIAAMRVVSNSVSADLQKQEITVEYCHRHKHHREVLARFAETPEIREMKRDLPTVAKGKNK
jgi:putative Mg2+ transporter-C (MgtC) family protein